MREKGGIDRRLEEGKEECRDGGEKKHEGREVERRGKNSGEDQEERMREEEVVG